jgi:hypothetical protein
MGWSLRKSVSVGPFRFNLSTSGVGMSVGIPGFRVGTGPRGNYVHVGAFGVSYRQTLAAPRTQVPRMPAPVLVPGTSGVAMQEIESSAATQIVDSSSDALIAEIREKRRRMSLTPFAVILGGITLLAALGAGWPGWAMLLLATLCTIGIVAARLRDRIAKTVVILYDFEPAAEDAFGRFLEWANALSACQRAWHIAAQGYVDDRKYHAGANSVVRRSLTSVRTAAPPFLKTNVPVLSIGVGRQTLYFLPDRLLICDSSGAGAVSYRTLHVSARASRFIEDGGVPGDATVVDSTWQYVNRSGGPDRRFSHNPQLPICAYEEVTFRTDSGLNEVIQLSRAGIGNGFVAAVRYLAAAIPA